MEIPQLRLDIWIYKYLLGTLPDRETKLLKDELERRYFSNEIASAIELKLYAAFTINRPTRQYLGHLLDDWEKRSYSK
jgi:hypothetical protein